MTANELYERARSLPYDEASYIWEGQVEYLKGCYFDHMPEVSSYAIPSTTNIERMGVRTLANFDYDGRRIWRLATVWFDDQPFMITQNAGREGDDHARRFITDWKVYEQAVHYLMSLYQYTDDPEDPFYTLDPNEDVGDTLTFFYNDSLDTPFERHDYSRYYRQED